MPRQRDTRYSDTTSVRLTRKLADVIDGVDLKEAEVGDELDLSRHDANMLIAEGWAEPTRRRRHPAAPPAMAADKAKSPKPTRK